MNGFQCEALERAYRTVSSAKRIVTKVGTSVLEKGGRLDTRKIEQIAADISGDMDAGRKVVHVSSGAILAELSRIGREKEDYRTRFADPGEYETSLRHLSVRGQHVLMGQYDRAFGRHGRRVAQVLGTSRDVREYRKIIEFSLDAGDVCILNENDARSFEGIKFGDNDLLSAAACIELGADVLSILSDSELCDGDPSSNQDVCRLQTVYVDEITDEMIGHTNGTGVWGTGGMRSKLVAARMVGRPHGGRPGIPTLLIDYKNCDYGDMRIQKAFRLKYKGTLFVPSYRN